MSENIGVVDWFTKRVLTNIQYPEDSDQQLEKLVEEVVCIFDKSQKLSHVANHIYDNFSNHDIFIKACSDSKFPVCSLFHHLKITSGIAVCLLLQKLDKEQEFIEKSLEEYGISADYKTKDLISLIRIAAMVSGIGKIKTNKTDSAQKSYSNHSQQSKEIIESILSKTCSPLVGTYELEKILPLLVLRYNFGGTLTSLEQLLNESDSIASAADRINEIEYQYSNGVITIKSNDRIFPHEIILNTPNLSFTETPHTSIIGYKQSIIQNIKLKDNSAKTSQLFVDHISHGVPVVHHGDEKAHSESIGLLSVDIMGIQGFINEADNLKMLRGGSAIVDKVLKRTEEFIAQEVCREAVLFSGGGNLLSFIPNTEKHKQKLSKKIEDETREISSGGLKAAVVTLEEPLSIVAGRFNQVLQDSQDKLEHKKNSERERKIIPTKTKICGYCFKRGLLNTFDKCNVCRNKEIYGQSLKDATYMEYVPQIAGTHFPTTLSDIGDSIAVLLIDGNLMGRLFQQTMTPAEYSYKSQVFDSKFKDILKRTIDSFLKNEINLELIKHEKDGKTYLGLDVLYAGGDDILMIINAKVAVNFSVALLRNIARSFVFEKRFNDGSQFKNPVVTASCGIAIADNKFPIYFLLNSARDMESIAKKEFRKHTKTNDFNIIELPTGAIALTAINSAMPTSAYSAFIVNDDPKKVSDDLTTLQQLINFAFGSKKSLVTEIVTCGNSVQERLNLIKFMYSSINRKERDIKLEDCEWMSYALLNEDILQASKMLIPHLLRQGEERSS